MLDSLFALGQLASLFGLAAGFVLTVRYRRCANETHSGERGSTSSNLVPLRREGATPATSPNALGAGHVGKAAA
jgi:hypothetical protein